MVESEASVFTERRIDMDISNESPVLQSIVKVAPYIPLFIDEPVSVAVTNTTGLY